MSSPETNNGSTEKKIDSAELESINAEQREILRNSLEQAEKAHESSKGHENAKQAKQIAIEKAEPSKDTSVSNEKSPAEKRTGLITRRHRDESFNRQMKEVQGNLSSSERTFSKIIHNKTIEKTSDALAGTVARPNALLAGSVSAFLFVTAVYLIAKYYGYPLSGFETIGSFILGWIIGLIYDYIRVMASGKK